MKLKHTEKKAYRDRQLEKQGGICPLCENEIPKGQETLDHNHSTGKVRMVLCSWCNSVEGRVNAWVSRVKADNSTWLHNLVQYYHNDYSDNPIYPSHRNELEKEIAKLRKQKKKVKLNKTKQRYQAKIDRLQKQLLKEQKSEKSNSQEPPKSSNNRRVRKRPKRARN